MGHCCLRDSEGGKYGCEPGQLWEVEGMRGVPLKWLKYFGTLAHVDKSRSSFTYIF